MWLNNVRAEDGGAMVKSQRPELKEENFSDLLPGLTRCGPRKHNFAQIAGTSRVPLFDSDTNFGMPGFRQSRPLSVSVQAIERLGGIISTGTEISLCHSSESNPASSERFC